MPSDTHEKSGEHNALSRTQFLRVIAFLIFESLYCLAVVITQIILGGPLHAWPGLAKLRSQYNDIPTWGWKTLSAGEVRKYWTPCALLICACVIVFGFFGIRSATLKEYKNAWAWTAGLLKTTRSRKVRPHPISTNAVQEGSESTEIEQ